MTKFKELSATELEIMEVIWNSNTPKTHIELLEHFNNECLRDWKPQTLTTYTTRLLEKGVIKATKKGRAKHYSPAVTKYEYESNKAKGILDVAYEGSIKRFMTALYDGKAISKVEMDELKTWLADK